MVSGAPLVAEWLGSPVRTLLWIMESCDSEALQAMLICECGAITAFRDGSFPQGAVLMFPREHFGNINALFASSPDQSEADNNKRRQ